MSKFKKLKPFDEKGRASHYLDSGEWQSDFEADERGEIPKDFPRGVLSEDGLYNVLYRFQDVLEQMSLIVHHIEQSDKGSRA